MAVPTDKQRLKKTTMQVKDVWRKKEIRTYIFHWTIPNFNNLKKNVEYENVSHQLKWSFTIVKKSSLYEVTIHTDDYDKGIRCAVRYKDYVCSNSVFAKQFGGGVYKVDIPNSVIKAPSNLYLLMNEVVLVFRFNECEILTVGHQPKPVTDACDDIIKMDMKRMLQRASKCLFPDFVIRGKEGCFEVHKAILAARSHYFRRYIRDNCKDGERGEINLDVPSSVMCSFLSYLYTERIRYSTKENFVELCDLLHRLGILERKVESKTSLQR